MGRSFGSKKAKSLDIKFLKITIWRVGKTKKTRLQRPLKFIKIIPINKLINKNWAIKDIHFPEKAFSSIPISYEALEDTT